jgi:hypothetical protein
LLLARVREEDIVDGRVDGTVAQVLDECDEAVMEELRPLDSHE